MKSESTMARVLVGIVLLVATSGAAGFLAYVGATVAGKPEARSAFDLFPAFIFILASVTAVISFGPVAAGYHRLLGKKIGEGPISAMIASAVIVSVMALPAGCVTYKGLYFYGKKRSEERRLSWEREEAHFDRIRNDPAVVVRERWFDAQDERKKAYERSIVNDSIAYDGRTLGELYALDKARSPLFLGNRAIDDELLERRFEHALEVLTKQNKVNGELPAILNNPKVKRQWIEAVAELDTLKGEGFEDLKSLIDSKRKTAGPGH